MFRALDHDGSGTIDIVEVGAMLTSIGESMSSDEVTAMMQEADVNSDGVIDFKEFTNMMRRGVGRRGRKNAGEQIPKLAVFVRKAFAQQRVEFNKDMKQLLRGSSKWFTSLNTVEALLLATS